MGWIETVISALRPGQTAPFPERWLFFTTQRQGQPVGVFSNTALSDHLLARSENHVVAMLRCRIEAGGPVPTPEEDEKLDKLGNRMEKHCAGVGGIFLGRVTGAGTRCHYFLLPKSGAQVADDLVGLAEKAGYSALAKLADDPALAIYTNDLLPSPEERREALDVMAVTHLENAGDLTAATHRVEHWAVFTAPDAARGFAEEMQKEGYELLPPAAGANPLSVHLAHRGKTTLEAITPTTCFLDAAARRHGGTYDGWGAKVVSKART